MAEKLPFMPLPLFLSTRVILPFTKRRFGFFGAMVAPAVLCVSIRDMALEMGAILGRARPNLMELLITCNCDRPSDPERVRSLRAALAKQAEELLANAGNPEIFGDLLAPTSAEIDAYTSDAVADVGEIAQIFVVYAMLGLEFGVHQPALTRTFVENKIAEIADPSDIPQALVNAGLKIPPGAGFRSYEEEEQAVLAMADEWRSRWGSKVEEWLRTQGAPCRLRDFLA